MKKSRKEAMVQVQARDYMGCIADCFSYTCKKERICITSRRSICSGANPVSIKPRPSPCAIFESCPHM